MASSIEKRSITLEAAREMVTAAVQKAREIGVPMAIAVVDPDGVLKAFAHMDGAALLAVRVAQQKAWTAASFSVPTHGLFDFIKDDPPLLTGLPHRVRRRISDQPGWPGDRWYRCERGPLQPGPGVRRGRSSFDRGHLSAHIRILRAA